MELKFKLATEPAVKAVIAIGAFAGITTIFTNSPNVVGISGCVLIGVLAITIGSYKTPPLCVCST
jgi:Ni,Fe-hydrogenase III small subunit